MKSTKKTTAAAAAGVENVPDEFVAYVAGRISETVKQIATKYRWGMTTCLERATGLKSYGKTQKHSNRNDFPGKFMESLKELCDQVAKAEKEEQKAKAKNRRAKTNEAVPSFRCEAVLRLRKAFSEAWPCGTSPLEVKQRTAMAKFIVWEWGRIQSVREEVLEELAKAPAVCEGDQLKQIASRSKVLASIDPENHFIYDSRVSKALNAYWTGFCGSKPSPFPLLQGRYDAEKASSDKVPVRKAVVSVPFLYEETYCAFVKAVADELASRHGFNNEGIGELRQKVEMALFTLKDSAGKEGCHE